MILDLTYSSYHKFSTTIYVLVAFFLSHGQQVVDNEVTLVLVFKTTELRENIWMTHVPAFESYTEGIQGSINTPAWANRESEAKMNGI